MELREKEANVIILSGKARVGKDTTGEYFKKFFENKGKKVKLLSYAYYIKIYAMAISSWNGNDENKPRSLLQELGTEIIRNKIDKLFFINRMIEDIKVYSYFFDTLIITDARIEEEIVNIKNTFSNVISINIERPGFVNELTSLEQSHFTETGLDNYKDYDYILINDGSLEELNNKVIKLGSEL